MKPIRLLHAVNVISRQRQRLTQELVFVALVQDLAYDKLVEVHWAGEDKAWHVLRAEYAGPAGAKQQVWRAHATFTASDDASLPGDVTFALHYRVQGVDHWDNNGTRNHAINADAGVLLGKGVQVANVDPTLVLVPGQRNYSIVAAVRHSLQPQRVLVHWTTDNWRTTQVTPCIFHRTLFDKWKRTSARNPNRYDTSLWLNQVKIDDAFRVQYAIACETPDGTFWDNNAGDNHVARRRRLKVLTLNLHCYQEDNQDAKFSQVAKAIDDLEIDVVCLQEVGELAENGSGNWDSNAAKIIRDRLRQYYYLHTDWSHLGFERYREGVAILSRHEFLLTDAGYVSSSHDVHSIDARKVVMAQIAVPYMGHVNVFSAHLSWPSGGYFEQLDRLRAWANEKHGTHLAATLVCGDFNVKAGSDGYQAVVRAREFEDQFLAATSRKLSDRDGRIDFVFMKNAGTLQAVAARELFTNGDGYGRVSDHTGYCVEFEPGW